MSRSKYFLNLKEDVLVRLMTWRRRRLPQTIKMTVFWVNGV